MSAPARCPTCRTPWRGAAACPRCGTDLTPPMRVAARAWELRQAARDALAIGRADEACAHLLAAMRLHATPQGQRLLALALIGAGRGGEARPLVERLVWSSPAEVPTDLPEARDEGT